MMTAERIIETTSAAGITLSIAPGGGLAVKPASKLTPVLRELIRTGKNDLVLWFEKKAIPVEVLQEEYRLYTRLALPKPEIQPDPEPPANPATWRELAQEYHRHHFACPTCIAGGQGRGMRCGVGASLWTNYQTKSTESTS